MHDTKQDKKGKWRYRDAEKRKGKEKDTEEEEERNNKLDGLEMTVPHLTGNAKAIQLLKSSKALKNLGPFARPDGCVGVTWLPALMHLLITLFQSQAVITNA